ncbi:hypothetical protein BG015_006763 [Linnemannia schmuckeri]|uniref:Transcription factor TFIIIC triple barrel domain-containing protein n=1 Tax=Linnemannia schmuckeri TaxID=64567 RepID=A0A9P5S209_9FUNG|nr:hypothetical protein BG015_006763 [Linnemannia schmuckeri]
MDVQEHTADAQQQDSQDWEWVEETEYIVLDFGGSNLDASDMEQLTTKGYSLIGLETESPYFRCGAHTFKGCFEENAFTEDLIFNMKVREDVEEGMEDSEEDNTDALDLLTITTKRVIFDPVELVRNERMASVDIDVLVENNQPQQLDEAASKALARGSSQSIWKAARQAAGMSTVTKRNRVIGTNTVVNKSNGSGVTKNRQAAAGSQGGEAPTTEATGGSRSASAAGTSGASEDAPMELD